MSVLVRGMDMPESCSVCVAGYGGFCFVAPPESDGVCPPRCKRPDWCPLVEVKSPHGRLIDAQRFKNENSYFWDRDFVNPKYSETLADLVNEAPTALEAED